MSAREWTPERIAALTAAAERVRDARAKLNAAWEVEHSARRAWDVAFERRRVSSAGGRYPAAGESEEACAWRAAVQARSDAAHAVTLAECDLCAVAARGDL